MNTWTEWADDTTGKESARIIAAKIGYSHTSINQWRHTGRPPADAVITIARVYRRDLILGLMAAGIISREDVFRGIEDRMRMVPAVLLLDELSRRAREEGWGEVVAIGSGQGF